MTQPQPQIFLNLNINLNSTSTLTSTQFGCDIKATQSCNTIAHEWTATAYIWRGSTSYWKNISSLFESEINEEFHLILKENCQAQPSFNSAKLRLRWSLLLQSPPTHTTTHPADHPGKYQNGLGQLIIGKESC